MNWTLNKRARHMRIHTGLPRMFQAKAFSTATYLINKGLSILFSCKLLEEEWIGTSVNISHLKVFGYISYVHVNTEKRDKLDIKLKKCFFIGYDTDEFGYKFWSKKDRKIIKTKDVVFNEKKIYQDKDDLDNVGELVKEKIG